MNEIDPTKSKGDSHDVSEVKAVDSGGYNLDAQGGRVPELGGSSNYDDDLARMYVRPKHEDAHARTAKITQIQAGQKEPMGGLAKFGIFLFVIVIGTAIAAYLVPMTVLDEYGTEENVALYEWVLHQNTRSERVAALESMNPEFRRYFLTKERVELIYRKASDFAARGEPIPTLNTLVNLGLITQAQSADGFGNSIDIQGRDLIRVSAAGADGKLGTLDDTVNDNGKLRLPEAYSTLELQHRGG